MHAICTVILDVLLGLGFRELIFTAHRSGGVSEGSDAEGGIIRRDPPSQSFPINSFHHFSMTRTRKIIGTKKCTG